ncbi:right-handed parallel beta-helix repeat-containing protein [candidate division KSB1 bacterium]|nr:right-handed parallel beta-helix repeat-containing protein [candidate division KSB1 bacterium]
MKKLLIYSFLINLLLINLLLSSTYYISETDGNDLYNGLFPKYELEYNGPFATITKAASLVQPGDTVSIRGGQYNEQVIISVSGETLKPIVFTNFPGEIPVISAASWNGSYAFNLDSVSCIFIIGLDFSSSPEDRKALLLDYSHQCLVSNCTFKNNGGSAAVHLKNGSSLNEISDCYFEDNGNNERIWDSHLFLQSCGVLNRIKRNTFTQTSVGNNLTDRGICCERTSNTLIHQNLFNRLERLALFIGIAEEDYIEGEKIPGNNIISDNEFYNNKGTGCLLSHTDSTILSGCAFFENRGEYTLSIEGLQSSDNLIDNNRFRENWSPTAERSDQISIWSAGPGNKITNNEIYGVPGESEFQIIKSFTAINIYNTSFFKIENNVIYDINYPATIDKTLYNTDWIKTPAEGGRAGHGIYIDGGDMVINGAEIRNNRINQVGASAISLENVENSVISDNTCNQNGAWGISVSGRNNTIEKNETGENGWMHGGCSGINIHGKSPGNIVRQNLSYNNHQGTAGEVGFNWWDDGNGIIADQGADSSWIYNNICFGNEGAGIAITASSYCFVLNNTIVANGYCEHAGNKAGLAVVSTIENIKDASNETVIGNILVNNAYYQMIIADIANDSHLFHHNLYNNGPVTGTEAIIHYRDEDIPTYERDFNTIRDFQSYWKEKGNSVNCMGSLDTNPLLVCGGSKPDSAADVYLLATSPARKASVAMSQWFQDDFFTVERVKYEMWDMGAVQFINHLPHTFVLREPANRAKLKSLNPVLYWESVIDPDPGDTVFYNLKISQDKNFQNAVITKTLSDTLWTVDKGLKENNTYYWKVTAVDFDGAETECAQVFAFTTPGSTDVAVDGAQLPKKYRLYQNYPNPFNSQTTIKYQLPEASHVKIVISNILGQNVATLTSKQKLAGYYSTIWNGKDFYGHDVPSGLYLINLDAKSFHASRKMLLIR